MALTHLRDVKGLPLKLKASTPTKSELNKGRSLEVMARGGKKAMNDFGGLVQYGGAIK